MTSVGIYTRLSRDRDGTKPSTGTQEKNCRTFAEQQGLEVVAVYRDSDLSGSTRDLERPDYERMLDDLRKGVIGGILVWRLDRLTRQPGQFEAVVRACEDRKARIWSATEPADMTSPLGLAMLRIGMTFAALESESIGQRTLAAKERDADAGLPNGGGLRPFGLTKDKQAVVPAEAALVREAAKRVIAGEGLVPIARDWEKRGVVSSRGNPWTVTALRRMLRNPRLEGKRVHKGRVIDSEVIPAILEPTTAERVRQLLTRPPAPNFSRRPRKLSGIVRCDRCGCRMQVKHRQNGTALYRCFKSPGERNCGGMVIVAEPLEEMVGAAIAEALESLAFAKARAAHAGEATSSRVAELEVLRGRLTRLNEDHHLHDLVQRDEYLVLRAELSEVINRIEDELGLQDQRQATAELGPGETVGAAWEARDAAWCQNLARAFLSRVVIAPAKGRGSNRFDPDRVSLEFLG